MSQASLVATNFIYLLIILFASFPACEGFILLNTDDGKGALFAYVIFQILSLISQLWMETCQACVKKKKLHWWRGIGEKY